MHHIPQVCFIIPLGCALSHPSGCGVSPLVTQLPPRKYEGHVWLYVQCHVYVDACKWKHLIILNPTLVKKWKWLIFDRKSEKTVFISINKKPSELTSESLSKFPTAFPMVGGKSQTWNRCNFCRRVRRFRIKILLLFAFVVKMKVSNAFNAKKGPFRERHLWKVENGQFWTHLTLQILDPDENLFSMDNF